MVVTICHWALCREFDFLHWNSLRRIDCFLDEFFGV
jgi:hypothetical protein